jgi:hypothetical protein
MLDVVRGVHLILHFGQQRHGNEHFAMDLGRLYLVASRDRPKSLLAIDSPQKMCQKCGVRSKSENSTTGEHHCLNELTLPVFLTNTQQFLNCRIFNDHNELATAEPALQIHREVAS